MLAFSLAVLRGHHTVCRLKAGHLLLKVAVYQNAGSTIVSMDGPWYTVCVNPNWSHECAPALQTGRNDDCRTLQRRLLSSLDTVSHCVLQARSEHKGQRACTRRDALAASTSDVYTYDFTCEAYDTVLNVEDARCALRALLPPSNCKGAYTVATRVALAHQAHEHINWVRLGRMCGGT
jgi:hypothetical protein